MTEPRKRGRPRSVGAHECSRCHHLVPWIRVHWPEGPICGPCFTAAARTYGRCAFCGAERLLPGRSPTGQALCRDCAGITTNLQCDHCGREAERLRRGHCARCVLTSDLEAILQPRTPPDMRIKRLITELVAVPRPASSPGSAIPSRPHCLPRSAPGNCSSPTRPSTRCHPRAVWNICARC